MPGILDCDNCHLIYWEYEGVEFRTGLPEPHDYGLRCPKCGCAGFTDADDRMEYAEAREIAVLNSALLDPAYGEES